MNINKLLKTHKATLVSTELNGRLTNLRKMLVAQSNTIKINFKDNGAIETKLTETRLKDIYKQIELIDMQSSIYIRFDPK